MSARLREWAEPKMQRASVLGARAARRGLACAPIYFAASAIAVLVFYIQALTEGGANASFLFSGDVDGYYWPNLLKLADLIGNGIFSGIDYSLFNGSSDYFLAPNFFSAYPPAVLFALLSPDDPGVLWTGYVLVLMAAGNSFIASYFAHKLMCRYFGFDFFTGGLVAIVFAFGYGMVGALGQLPFLFSTAPLPWIAYQAIRFAQQPSLPNLLLGMLPVLLAILGGYPPIGLACCLASVGLVLAHSVLVEFNEPIGRRLRSLTLAALPYISTAILVSPYLLSIVRFNKQTTSTDSPNLFYSALQYAEDPASILRALSFSFNVPGPLWEFTTWLGTPVAVIVLVFVLSKKTFSSLTLGERRILVFGGAVYIFSALVSYGQYSPLSSIFYYFVPILGSMHIYQRFMLLSWLFFAISLALMTSALVRRPSPIVTRVTWLILAASMFVGAYLVSSQPELARALGISNRLVFEALVALIVLTVLLVPLGRSSIALLTALFLVGPLNFMYGKSQTDIVLSRQLASKPAQLDAAVQTQIAEFTRSISDKEVYKYADLTPLWFGNPQFDSMLRGGNPLVETFPKSFPYFVLDDVRLSSYGGFSFYLAARADYLQTMPIYGPQVLLAADWPRILAQGADFVVVAPNQLDDPAYSAIRQVLDTDRTLELSTGVRLIAIDRETVAPQGVFDNGMFRVLPGALERESGMTNLALGATVTQSGGAPANMVVDDNADGNFAGGSVSHTDQNANAWLDLDLGASYPIDRIVLWDRTDCCQERQLSPWVFLSETPFGSGATADEVASDPAIWRTRMLPSWNNRKVVDTEGETARYVRVQLTGQQDPAFSFLSVAELQVFRADEAEQPANGAVRVESFASNFANASTISIDSSGPATLQYLFSANPRLIFRLNGDRITPQTSDSGLLSIELPAGRNEIEVTYRNRTLVVFWVLYFAFFGAILLVFALRALSYGHATSRRWIAYGRR